MNVWEALIEVEKAQSEYMKSSKLRQSMEAITLEFQKSGLDLPDIPGREVAPENYESAFQKFITRVLGAEHGTAPKETFPIGISPFSACFAFL